MYLEYNFITRMKQGFLSLITNNKKLHYSTTEALWITLLSAKQENQNHIHYVLCLGFCLLCLNFESTIYSNNPTFYLKKILTMIH